MSHDGVGWPTNSAARTGSKERYVSGFDLRIIFTSLPVKPIRNVTSTSSNSLGVWILAQRVPTSHNHPSHLSRSSAQRSRVSSPLLVLVPSMATFPPPKSDHWRTGFCDCFQDCESCVLGYFCPCIVVGRIVEIVDQGATSCVSGCCTYYCLQTWTGCGCLYTCGYRGRLRQKYGLPASPCSDLFVDHWCPFCSYTQQYRELKLRGINPALGYAANRHIYEAPPPLQAAPAPQVVGYVYAPHAQPAPVGHVYAPQVQPAAPGPQLVGHGYAPQPQLMHNM